MAALLAVPGALQAVVAARASTGRDDAGGIGGAAELSPQSVLAAPMPASEAQPALLAGAAGLGPIIFEGLTEPSPPASGFPESPGLVQLQAFARRRLSSDEPRFFALLSDSSDLRPARAPCRQSKAAIAFDLDPAGGLVRLYDQTPQAPALTATLEGLRQQGIATSPSSGSPIDRPLLPELFAKDCAKPGSTLPARPRFW